MKRANTSSYWTRGGALGAACAAALLLFAGESHAQAAATCTGGGTNIAIALPASISVPRDAPVGTVLTAWTLSPGESLIFSCNAPANVFIGARVMYIGGEEPTGVTVAPPSAGSRLPVVPTNVPGIGLAVGGRVRGCGTSAWNDGNGWPRLVRSSCSNSSAWSRQTGGQVTFALVKIRGSVSAGTVRESGSLLELRAGGASDHSGTWSPVTYSLASTTNIVPLTCRTSDVDVPMGSVPNTSFTGAGTTSRPRSYAIQLTGCPTGITAITYQLDPVTAVVDPVNSVIALTAGGAGGVGLQLMDDAGRPVPLGTPVPVSGYTPGGDVSIPLTAAYYQTGATRPEAGDANAVVHFTMSYE